MEHFLGTVFNIYSVNLICLCTTVGCTLKCAFVLYNILDYNNNNLISITLWCKKMISIYSFLYLKNLSWGECKQQRWLKYDWYLHKRTLTTAWSGCYGGDRSLWRSGHSSYGFSIALPASVAICQFQRQPSVQIGLTWLSQGTSFLSFWPVQLL